MTFLFFSKNKHFKNISWAVINSIAGLSISFLSSFFYLRVFSPENFGSIVIEYLILSLGLIFSEFGLSGALIQRNKTDNLIFKSFTLSFLISILIGILYLSYILIFKYSQISLIMSIIILLSLCTNSFIIPYKNILSIKEDYHYLSKFNCFALALSHLLVITIILSSSSPNIWMLFSQRLIMPSILLIFFFFHLKNLSVKLDFKFRELVTQIGFGSKLMISNLLETAYKQGLNVLFSFNSLLFGGLFLQANRLTDIYNGLIFNISNTILFSRFLRLDTKNTFKIKKYFIYTLLILTSLGIIIMTYFGKPIISLLYGEKWVGLPFILSMLLLINYNVILDNSVRGLFKSKRMGSQILTIEILKKLLIVLVFINFFEIPQINLFIYTLTIITSIGSFLTIYIAKKYIKEISFSSLFYITQLNIIFSIFYIETSNVIPLLLISLYIIYSIYKLKISK